MFFGTILLILILPLCILRYLHTLCENNRMQRPRLRMPIFGWWVRKLWILATIDRLFFPMVLYVLYLTVGERRFTSLFSFDRLILLFINRFFLFVKDHGPSVKWLKIIQAWYSLGECSSGTFICLDHLPTLTDSSNCFHFIYRWRWSWRIKSINVFVWLKNLRANHRPCCICSGGIYHFCYFSQCNHSWYISSGWLMERSLSCYAPWELGALY